MNTTTTSTSPQQHGGITLSQVWAMLTPWRWSLTLVGVSVLLGAVLELVPALLVQQIVDAHLKLGRSEGLLWIAGSVPGRHRGRAGHGVSDRVSHGHHCAGRAPPAAGAPLRPPADVTPELL